VRLADSAAASAFTGSGKMCATALVDWLFQSGPNKDGPRPPTELLMGDLGSGKTSAYFFRRTEEGRVAVVELTDNGSPDLPSLAGTPFEEWAAAFARATGDYFGKYPVHIGATQWYRELPQEQQVDLGLKLWQWGEQTFPHGFRLLEISGDREAACEASACQYACEAVLNTVPGLILSSGTGSMQFTSGDESMSIALDTKTWSKKSREEIPAFYEAARQALVPFAPLIRQHHDMALLLGAAWYAVVSAGLAPHKGPPFQIARMEAIASMEACVNNPETAMRDAVNVVRIIEALRMLGDFDVNNVVFARSWKVHGEDFKTTWSTGYFLNGCP